jgi:rhodanese-related sulfurtransferase
MTYTGVSLSRMVLRLFNIGIITLAILLAGLAVRRYRVAQLMSRTDIPAYFKAGARFPVQGLDWTRSHQTLVVVLEQSCALCDESAPFYRLIEQHRPDPSRTRFVVLLGGDPNNAGPYLQKLQLSFDEVKTASLRDLKPYGLVGTPTAVLVNDDGIVTNLWHGALTELQRSEVLRALQIRVDSAALESVGSATPSLETVDETEIQRLKEAGEQVTVLDLRDRRNYSAGHPGGAKNIPVDELAVRAVNELVTSDLIVLFGGDAPEKMCATAAQVLHNDGFTRLRILKTNK